jgi:hypothetical protein
MAGDSACAAAQMDAVNATTRAEPHHAQDPQREAAKVADQRVKRKVSDRKIAHGRPGA